VSNEHPQSGYSTQTQVIQIGRGAPRPRRTEVQSSEQAVASPSRGIHNLDSQSRSYDAVCLNRLVKSSERALSMLPEDAVAA
jgi:hypothetical protein